LLRPAALALAIAGLVAVVIWRLEDLEHLKELCAATARAQAVATRAAEQKKVLDAFADKGMAETLSRGQTIPSSAWIEREKVFYTKILKAGHFDVLVIPVMPRDCAFDRATRSALTAQLALAVSRAQNAKVQTRSSWPRRWATGSVGKPRRRVPARHRRRREANRLRIYRSRWTAHDVRFRSSAG
jgi:hypothetical protein